MPRRPARGFRDRRIAHEFHRHTPEEISFQGSIPMGLGAAGSTRIARISSGRFATLRNATSRHQSSPPAPTFPGVGQHHEPDVLGGHLPRPDQTNAQLRGGVDPRIPGRGRAIAMHYLVTGHTGFKGPWLTLLLLSRGHRVSGLALDPAEGSLFNRARLADQLVSDFRVDIRDAEATAAAVSAAAPDVVVHMAAQSLVRESYRNPRYTYETNAIGTLNMLDDVAASPSVRAHVVITTDKV